MTTFPSPPYLTNHEERKSMAQQEEGWPLGLQPLNVRVGLVRNREVNGSLSFNTLLTASPVSSSHSSSDLDTESTGSFFHDKSITLGSLIGISSILELSRRSNRGRTTEPIRNKRNYKTRTWFLSLCSRLSTDAVSMNNNNNNNNNAPSLGHFLEAERRGGVSNYGRPDDFSRVLDPNSLFVEGRIAPPPPPQEPRSRGWVDSNEEEPPLLLSCLCGNLTH